MRTPLLALALLLGPMLAGCGPEGIYRPDRKAMEEDSGGILEDLAQRVFADQDLRLMLRADGSFVLDYEEHSWSGTFRQEGGRILFSPTRSEGEEDPPTISAADYADGRITMTVAGVRLILTRDG